MTMPMTMPMNLETKIQRGGCSARASIIEILDARERCHSARRGGCFQAVVEFESQVKERCNERHQNRGKQDQWNVGPRGTLGDHAGVEDFQALGAIASRRADLLQMHLGRRCFECQWQRVAFRGASSLRRTG